MTFLSKEHRGRGIFVVLIGMLLSVKLKRKNKAMPACIGRKNDEED